MTLERGPADTHSGLGRWLKPLAGAVALVMLLGACAGSVDTEDVADAPAASASSGGDAALPVEGPVGSEELEGSQTPGTQPSRTAAPQGATRTDTATRRTTAENRSSRSLPAATGAGGGSASGTSPKSERGSGPSGSESQAPSAPTSGASTAPGPAGSGPGSVPAAQDGVIKIGMVYPLSGPLGPNGRSMLEGFQSMLSRAVDEGSIQGARFKFLVRDDQFDPSQSKRYVRELIAEGIWAFSGFTPALWLAAKDELLEAGVLGFPFDVGAERQRQVRTSFAPYQNCLRAQAGTVVKALERGHKRIAFLELDIEAVHHCVDYSAALVEKLGGEVVYRGNVAPGAPDCGPQVLAARSANADTVLPFIEVLGTIKCVQAVRQQGWDIPIQVGFNIAGDTAFVDALGKDAEGVTSVSPWTAMPTYPEWEQTCGVTRRYYPDHVASLYSSIGCAAGMVLAAALSALGPTATRDQVVEYLETHPVSTRGLSPDITYRPGDHRPFDSVIPVEVKDGRWVKTGETFVPARLSEDINDGE